MTAVLLDGTSRATDGGRGRAMRRRVGIAGLVLALVASLTGPVPGTSAALPVSYTTAFNIPQASSYPIATRLISLIEDAGAGTSVRLALGQVEGDDDSLHAYRVADALRQRSDLDLRVVVTRESYVKRDLVYQVLEQAADYVYVCNEDVNSNGCLQSNRASPTMHNKFLLIRSMQSGDQYVVAQSSANWTPGGLGPNGKHQDLVVVRNDQDIYEKPDTGGVGGYRRYWTQMAGCADRVKPGPVERHTCSGVAAEHSVVSRTGNRTWFFPGTSPGNDDTRVAEIIDNATCRSATSGSVDRIRIAMFFFWERDSIADALRRAKGRNCTVELVLDNEQANNAAYVATLRASGITVRCLPKVHHKYMVIEDSQGARVYAGSHNYHGGSDDNEDAILRVWDAAVARDYSLNFDLLNAAALTHACPS